MPRLLHVTASPRGPASFSRRVAAELVAALCQADPALAVIERDLAAAPLPHPDAAFTKASLMPEAERDAADHAALALSERLIAELEAADALLVATPMHNFTVPSALKAWLDYVVRPRRTFGFSPAGKVGLLRDRPVFVAVACGGRFGDGPGAQVDFLEPYLRYVLGVIGLHDLRLLRLEEMNRDLGKVERALAAARGWIAEQGVAPVASSRAASAA